MIQLQKHAKHVKNMYFNSVCGKCIYFCFIANEHNVLLRIINKRFVYSYNME